MDYLRKLENLRDVDCSKLWDCCKRDDTKKEESKDEIVLPTPQKVKSMDVTAITHVCQEAKTMLAVSVNVMKNFLGKPCYPFLTQPRQMYPYIRYLCGEENIAAKSRLLDKQPQNVRLSIVIREAKIVHPRYSTFSQVFCKVSVSNAREYTSSVKENDRELVWEEVFNFKVSSPENDTVTVEIWSSHPQNKSPRVPYVEDERPSGPPRPNSYRIGNITAKIKDLPCAGRDLLWTLKKGPRRMNTRGQILVFVELSTERGPEHVFHVHMQMQMLKLSYEKQLPSLKNDKKWKNWLEILPNPAVTLLQQHALQNGISSTEQCVCSWIVASSIKINQEDRVSFYFLYTLLEGLTADIYKDPIEPYLEEALKSGAEKYGEFNKKILGNLHSYFQVQAVEDADELFYLLKSMCGVEMQTYSNYLDSYVIIAGESHVWYLSIFTQFQDDLLEDDCSIEKLCDTLNKIVKIFLKNQIILDDIFTRAWAVSYSKITFTELDSVINDTIKPIIEHLMIVMRDPERKRVIKESLQLLQLYHNVRNLVQYVLNDLPSERAVLAMDGYSSWFGEDLILEWFLLCDIYTRPFIKRAVYADNMERVNRNILHGSSVPDVVSIIDEMVIGVWTKLDWDEQFYTHATLLEAVKTCVMDYIRGLKDKIKSEDLYGAKKELGINEKLCVVMSNAYAVFEHLYVTKNKIKGILRIAESKYGFIIMDPMAAIGSQMQIEVQRMFQKFVRKALRGTLDIFMSSSSSCWKKKSAHVAALQTLTQLQEIFYCDGHGLSLQEIRNPTFEELKQKIELRLKIRDKTVFQRSFLCV
ncbi:c2 domain-containing protein [Trichonephila clavata]|uniref:C2 domain-containing protein n=1 Tax=Trichonephila clavata TaxID=2740835 RepID=A0A8X6G7F3_TRICU|nr:c2 domain-containing protein [Trichonephila clavata]